MSKPWEDKSLAWEDRYQAYVWEFYFSGREHSLKEWRAAYRAIWKN